MSPLALAVIALVGWLWWTGKLKRLNANDGIAIVMALLAVISAVKGKPLLGAVPAVIAGLYALWRLRRPAMAPAGDMSVAEARSILGVGVDADESAIRAAHRRLIALTHPDRGGTEALARNINKARDVLLRHHAEKQMPHGGD
jgi:hypothetical protein